MTGAVKSIISKRLGWALFLMKEELGLEQPDPRQAAKSALLIGRAYVVGEIVPLAPYALVPSVNTALCILVLVSPHAPCCSLVR